MFENETVGPVNPIFSRLRRNMRFPRQKRDSLPNQIVFLTQRDMSCIFYDGAVYIISFEMFASIIRD
mgnify:CR=1 FL=1